MPRLRTLGMEQQKAPKCKGNTNPLGDVSQRSSESEPMAMAPPSASASAEWAPAKSGTATAAERRKQLLHIRRVHSTEATTHASALVHTVLIVTQVVSLAPARVRKDGVCLDDELEFLLIAAL